MHHPSFGVFALVVLLFNLGLHGAVLLGWEVSFLLRAAAFFPTLWVFIQAFPRAMHRIDPHQTATTWQKNRALWEALAPAPGWRTFAAFLLLYVIGWGLWTVLSFPQRPDVAPSDHAAPLMTALLVYLSAVAVAIHRAFRSTPGDLP